MSFTQSRSVKDILSIALSHLKERRERLDWYQLQIEKDKQVTDYSIKAVEKVISNCDVIAGRVRSPQELPAPPARTGAFQELTKNIQSAIDSGIPKPTTRAQCRPTRLNASGTRPQLQESGKFKPGELIVAVIWEVQNADGPLTRQELVKLLGVADNPGLSNALNKAVNSSQIKVDEDGLENLYRF